MKHSSILGFAVVASMALLPAPPAAQAPAQPRPASPAPQNAAKIPFKVVYDFLKTSPDMNFGEVLGVAVNSKGTIVVLNHPGTATSGPLYGNATTQLWEFDQNGKFVREIGRGVYGLGYAHSVRYDKYDNLWVVDKGTHSTMRFNPAGYVTTSFNYDAYGNVTTLTDAASITTTTTFDATYKTFPVSQVTASNASR